MMQKNTFKSIPLSSSGNSLYQRRNQKFSDNPNHERNVNSFLSEAEHSKDVVYEMPVYGSDRSYTSGQSINAESSELNEINEYYSRFASTTLVGSLSKPNLPAWKLHSMPHKTSTQEHHENFQRDDYHYYSDETKILSEQKLEYHKGKEEFMRNEQIWNRRSGSNHEEHFKGQNHQNLRTRDETICQRSFNFDSETECDRNHKGDSSEEYEENYLDMLEHQRDKNIMCQNSVQVDQNNDQQNSMKFCKANYEEECSVSHSFQDRNYEQDAPESYREDEETNRDMEEEYFYEWEKGYKNDEAIEYSNSHLDICSQKIKPRKSHFVNAPCSISKSNEPVYHSTLKENPPSHSFSQPSNLQQAYSSFTKPSSHSVTGLECRTAHLLPKSDDILKRKMESSQEKLNTKQKQIKIQEKTHVSEIFQKSVNMETRDQRNFESPSRGIVIIVVLKGFPKKRLVASELVKLETAILNKMDKIPEGAFHPQFIEYTKKRGSLVVVSKNRSSADWLKSVVCTLEPWEGAEVKTIEIGPESIRRLYISSGDPKSPLNFQQLNLIQIAIMEKAEKIGQAFEPELLDCYNKHQLLVVVCNGLATHDWLKDTVQILEPWENAELSWVDPTELGEYKKYKMCIAPWDESNKILYRIECQNDNLCVGTWKIINSKNIRGKPGVLVVAVPKNVVKFLRQIEFRPFLNLSRVLMQEVGDLNEF